jgi:UDP-N-acetylmuramate--alanine ligase
MDDIGAMKRFFLLGIGGVGMSALAVILKKRGFEVFGSDKQESEATKNLEKQGIQIAIGHSESNIKDNIDAVVFTNAISEDNPEYLKAKSLGIPLFERAKMLDFLACEKFSIGVSGTHGKTTTTSMVSKIFLNAGMDPTLAVGGYLSEIGGSGYEGKGKYFIYEACEAYGSFLKLHPNIAVITNIDSDHLDYYKTFKNVKKAFEEYILKNIPPYGFLIYNNDDAILRKVVRKTKFQNKISIGIQTKNADFTAEKIYLNEFSSSFLVRNKGKMIGEFFLNIPGFHNVTNALLAIAAAQINAIPYSTISSTLANFKNADRRFELKFSEHNFMVIDDYAHHPAEIDATLNAAKNLSLKKGAQLIAIFQPHLYSRTEQLYKEFARALSKADRVVLTEIYAAREVNIHKISARMIYDEVVKIKGLNNVIYSEKLSDIPGKVRPFLNGNNILITLGAGDVWKLSDMFRDHH